MNKCSGIDFKDADEGTNVPQACELRK
ncbi:hypothetical protein A2U01_0075365, partial [Trifolium medium]|nr:hypothetical protein [Trifolium medium]